MWHYNEGNTHGPHRPQERLPAPEGNTGCRIYAPLQAPCMSIFFPTLRGKEQKSPAVLSWVRRAYCDLCVQSEATVALRDMEQVRGASG